MTIFMQLLELHMRVNGISRAEMAEEIGIPKTALRRLFEGKDVKGSEMLTLINWALKELGE